MNGSDNFNKRIEAKLDLLVEKISNIEIDNAARAAKENEYYERTKEIEATLEPIKKHVNMVSGAVKLLALLAMLAGLIETIVILSRH